MLFGYSSKISAFEKLIGSGGLSQAYLFYGDEGVGKRTFARSLATAVERGKWEETSAPLLDAYFLLPGETGSIGIDAINEAKNFLWQKPVASPKRFLLVADSEALTDEAQGALLKVVEEPPAHALIIFVARARETLLPPLLSRLAKVYFPRLPEREVAKFLAEEKGTPAETAARVAAGSFGSIGRALNVLEGARPESDDVLGNLRAEIVRLYRTDVLQNAKKLRFLLERETLISRYNLNLGLQKKAIQEIITNF
jgi:DNA polymerase-3 subunit delta'